MSRDPLLDLENALLRCAGAVGEDAARGIAKVGLERIDRGFTRGVDINGKQYPIPKDGHRPPMIRTSILRSRYTTQIARFVRGRRITWRNRTPYAEYLREGTSKMAPREHMPKEDAPPPPDMDRAFRKAIDDSMTRYWRKVRI